MGKFWRNLFLRICSNFLLKTNCNKSVWFQAWRRLYQPHCVKSVQIRSFFWSVSSRIPTEYREILGIPPYSVRMRDNKDQKKLRIWAHFTQCQLLCITHGIYISFDEKYEVRGVIFDISKTIDKVWHEAIIFKLKQNSISGNLLECLADFFKDRKQRVVFNEEVSNWKFPQEFPKNPF